jgi:membrane fusion protein (multidrug efflux system)
MKSTRIFSSTALIATAGVLLSYGCGGKHSAEQNALASGQPPPAVVVAEVAQRTVPIYTEYVGQTKADETVDIRARVQGVLERAYFTEGAPVHKGQILFQIQKSEYEAKLLNAKAVVAKAEADLEQAKQRSDVIAAEARLAQASTMHSKAQSDLARYVPLAQENAVTQIDLDTARAAEAAAREEVKASRADLKNRTDSVKYLILKTTAALAAAKADLAQAQLDLSYCTVSSPISGIIGIQQVSVGNLVGKDGPTLLATVSSSNPIYVDFGVNEAYFLQLTKNAQRGSRANVGLQLVLSDNSVYEQVGRFSVADRTVDPTTGSILVRATFLNPNDRLRPGQFARIRVAAEERKDVLLVPQIAVQELQSAKYVMVVGADNKITQRTVKVGDRVEDNFIVIEGLQAGERVVTEGVQKVRPGMPVNPTETIKGS